ncbi:Acyl- dehydrogenase family member 11 [Lecanosticta acicola]|uniref:Acyl- dehydrogenase family member 11 n=1 Tax=Lecanosticta acicola TaxID=111012 RepID=A0AAI8YSZ8_9PEZI|nr:Acyl- dehydrogenase family member 11 [Lecanosticta acicola]
MSVPYKIQASEDLLVGDKNQPRASDKIPAIARPFVSDRAKKTLDLVEKFVEEECIPADAVAGQQTGEGVQQRFAAHPQVIEDLKKRAQELGLWNLFLPKNHFKEGAGFSNLEYGLMAEYLGKSFIASEACNCSAPDTGNMEVLAKYGTQAHKDRWLKPLLEGKIRSAFLMTEPDVASSDATNISLRMHKEGNEWVLNGQKWWSSGAGDKRCEIFIVMGKSDPDNSSVYKQQSVILVPFDTPGITIHRMLSVFGFDDAPHGHGHITFNNVRVPADNMVLGQGRGFEVIQGRLGPGRIHHAMRSIGAAERALEYSLARMNDPSKKPFGKLLSEHGVMLARVAEARVDIDAARLQVLNAAIMIDEKDAKHALKEIAEAKILVPKVALKIIDEAIQAYGGAGVAQDTPLAKMWASGRTMRIVDGPDEVHTLQMGRNENKKGRFYLERITWQKKKTEEMLKAYGLEKRDVLQLDRQVAKSKL